MLRRADNDKWYGVILSVAGSKLGLEDDNIIDVINLKSDPMLIGSLRGQKGYFPAYHMNKEKWISVLLGDAGLDEPIKNLLALSYELTAPKKKKNTSKSGGDLMSNFEFLKNTKEYALFAPAVMEAERVYASAPAMCAVGCRKALELAVKWVYSADNTMQMPYKDNLQSLIHEPSFRFSVDYNTWGKLPFIVIMSCLERMAALWRWWKRSAPARIRMLVGNRLCCMRIV